MVPEELREAVDAVTLGDALLKQRDDAERAIGVAVRKGRSEDLGLYIAEIDAAYQGVWDALDRAARALEARGRRPEAYDALRGGLGEAERKLGVFDATNTAGMQVTVGPGGVGLRKVGELGVVLNKEGVRVAREAAGALRAAMTEVDWGEVARAAAATAGPSVKVGKGLRAGPILFVAAIAAAAVGLYVVVGKSKRAAPTGEAGSTGRGGADIDLTRLLASDEATIDKWVRDNGARYPEARAKILAELEARLRARLPGLTDHHEAADLVGHARRLELPDDLVAAARARHAELLAPAIATLGLDDVENLLDAAEALGLSDELRARLLATYDAGVVRALAAGADVVELAVRVTSVTTHGALPEASAALRARATAALAPRGDLELALALRLHAEPAAFAAGIRALLVAAIGRARDLDELATLGDHAAGVDQAEAVAGALEARAAALLAADVKRAADLDALLEARAIAYELLPAARVDAAIAGRAAKLAAAEVEVEALGNWLGAELLDDRAAAGVVARATARARRDLAGARAFLEHSSFAELDVADEIAAGVGALCDRALARAGRGEDPVIVATATLACRDGAGLVRYAGAGDDEQVDKAAEGLAEIVDELLAAAGDGGRVRLTLTSAEQADIGLTVRADEAVADAAERQARAGEEARYPCEVELRIMATQRKTVLGATCSIEPG